MRYVDPYSFKLALKTITNICFDPEVHIIQKEDHHILTDWRVNSHNLCRNNIRVLFKLDH